MDSQRTGKVCRFINAMGPHRPKTCGKGTFVHKHRGSLWTHDARERFVHKTPCVPRDPRRTGKVLSFINHHVSPVTHDPRERLVRSQNTMCPQWPTTHGKGSFDHKTPCVPSDPRERFVRSQNTMCSQWPTTHGKGSFVHKTPCVPSDPRRTGEQHFRRRTAKVKG